MTPGVLASWLVVRGYRKDTRAQRGNALIANRVVGGSRSNTEVAPEVVCLAGVVCSSRSLRMIHVVVCGLFPLFILASPAPPLRVFWRNEGLWFTASTAPASSLMRMWPALRDVLCRRQRTVREGNRVEYARSRYQPERGGPWLSASQCFDYRADYEHGSSENENNEPCVLRPVPRSCGNCFSAKDIEGGERCCGSRSVCNGGIRCTAP